MGDGRRPATAARNRDDEGAIPAAAIGTGAAGAGRDRRAVTATAARAGTRDNRRSATTPAAGTGGCAAAAGTGRDASRAACRSGTSGARHIATTAEIAAGRTADQPRLSAADAELGRDFASHPLSTLWTRFK